MPIIELADHISKVDGKGDLVPACRRAVKHLRSGDTLRFPEGKHDLFDEAARQTLLPVTNHDICARVHGILLQGKKDVQIDGNGCTLFAHGQVSPLWIEDCDGIKIKNLSFDRREYLNASGTVTAAEEGWFELEMDMQTSPAWDIVDGVMTLRSKDSRRWSERLKNVFEWDSHDMSPAPGSVDNCGADRVVQWRAEQLDETKIRLNGNFPRVPARGNQIMLRTMKRYAPGVTMSRNSDLLFENVKVHACGGMAFIGQRCRDIIIRRCAVESSPHNERIDADCFDATHFSNCAGHIIIEESRFQNQLDDATNVHGAYFPVIRRIDDRILRVALAHPQQAGAPVGGPGDRFELCRRGSAEPYWSAAAEKVEPLNLRTVDVVFDEKLPGRVEQGDALDNIDWYPDFTMRGCTMRGNRARATLISTRGKAILEDNYFHSPGSGVQMSGGIGQWHESGPVRDCEIRNNHFDRCAYNAPVWGTALFQFKGENLDVAARSTTYHRNIRILNNRITCANDRILDLDSVGGLLFRDNKIELDGGELSEGWHKEERCEKIDISTS